jgi:hypothetical protein
MMLNTNKPKKVRKYYFQLEELVDKYENYVNEYNLSKQYKINPNPLNIFDFINENNYKINLSTWFTDL